MQTKNKPTKIFIISGPSGVGKTSVAKGVLKKLPFLKTTITYTTRNKRLGKKEDKTIIHVSEEKFREKIMAGDFLEWAIVHSNFYGTDRKTILERLAKNSILMNIDVQGALQIKKKLPQKTVLIFLKAENLTELTRRIKQREKMPEAIFQLRLKNAKKELALAKKYDYIAYNRKNQVNETIKQITTIIKGELK
ncbi:MAG: guanylate kinase [Patescibacteria group bacterium]